jgi:hypothetical protein
MDTYVSFDSNQISAASTYSSSIIFIIIDELRRRAASGRAESDDDHTSMTSCSCSSTQPVHLAASAVLLTNSCPQMWRCSAPEHSYTAYCTRTRNVCALIDAHVLSRAHEPARLSTHLLSTHRPREPAECPLASRYPHAQNLGQKRLPARVPSRMGSPEPTRAGVRALILKRSTRFS